MLTLKLIEPKMHKVKCLLHHAPLPLALSGTAKPTPPKVWVLVLNSPDCHDMLLHCMSLTTNSPFLQSLRQTLKISILRCTVVYVYFWSVMYLWRNNLCTLDMWLKDLHYYCHCHFRYNSIFKASQNQYNKRECAFLTNESKMNS